jgi:hypothetical protein
MIALFETVDAIEKALKAARLGKIFTSRWEFS